MKNYGNAENGIHREQQNSVYAQRLQDMKQYVNENGGSAPDPRGYKDMMRFRHSHSGFGGFSYASGKIGFNPSRTAYDAKDFSQTSVANQAPPAEVDWGMAMARQSQSNNNDGNFGNAGQYSYLQTSKNSISGQNMPSSSLFEQNKKITDNLRAMRFKVGRDGVKISNAGDEKSMNRDINSFYGQNSQAKAIFQYKPSSNPYDTFRFKERTGSRVGEGKLVGGDETSIWDADTIKDSLHDPLSNIIRSNSSSATMNTPTLFDERTPMNHKGSFISGGNPFAGKMATAGAPHYEYADVSELNDVMPAPPEPAGLPPRSRAPPHVENPYRFLANRKSKALDKRAISAGIDARYLPLRLKESDKKTVETNATSFR